VRIDAATIDVQEPPNISTGCLRRITRLGHDFLRSPILEDEIDLIPKSQWLDLSQKMVSLEQYMVWQHDQDGVGQCTCDAATVACEALDMIDNNKAVRLSPADLYRRINGGQDRGSALDTALQKLATDGVLPLVGQDFDHEGPLTDWRKKPPAGAEKTRLQFRIKEWTDIASFEGMATVLFKGFPVVWAREGHAICAVKPVFATGSRQWFIRSRNSHGNHNPYYHDSVARVRRGIAQYGAWAARVVIVRNENATQ
jgi:hypothetical protein